MKSQPSLSPCQRKSLLRALGRRQPIQSRTDGFTLSELVIVVIILGVLSAIALPSFMNQRNRAYLTSAKAWASSEARKCAAALAAGSSTDFTPQEAPQGLGTTVTAAEGECEVGGVWSASGSGTTHTFTVGEGGSLTTGSSATTANK